MAKGKLRLYTATWVNGLSTVENLLVAEDTKKSAGKVVKKEYGDGNVQVKRIKVKKGQVFTELSKSCKNVQN